MMLLFLLLGLILLLPMESGAVCCIRPCNTFSRFTYDTDCTINRPSCPSWFPHLCSQPPDCSGLLCPENSACAGNTCICKAGFYPLTGEGTPLQSEVSREAGKATAREEGKCLSIAKKCSTNKENQCGVNQVCQGNGQCKCLAG